MTLSAAQLIYTNVEKRLSPNGRDGYQIWLKTPNLLHDRDETEVQSRLSDFEERRDGTIPSDESITRHVYFRLTSGRIVLARSVPLNMTDEFNRGGRFYAHALILEPDVFALLDADPFAVLDQFQFQSTIDEGARSGNPANGTIPPAVLQPRQRQNQAPALPHEKLVPVLLATLRACDGHKPALLGLTASPTQAQQILRQVFLWLPRSLRLACSFDTLSTGRSLTQLPFAVAALPGVLPRRYLNLVVFDAARQIFPFAAVQPNSATFDHWLAAQTNASDLPPNPTRSESAYQLGTALDSGIVNPSQMATVERDLFEELVYSDAGIPKLERMLWPRLQVDVGDVLAPMIYSHALAWLRGGGMETFMRLAEPLDARRLLGWMSAAYENRRRHEIQFETEIGALKEFLERTKNVDGETALLRKRLVLIFYRWAGRWLQLARSSCDTRTIPDELYYWFVDWSLRTLPILVEVGCGATSRGAWCGPTVSPLDPADDGECQSLLGSLLGQAKKSEGESESETGPQKLPPERLAWVLQHLLTLASGMPLPAEST